MTEHILILRRFGQRIGRLVDFAGEFVKGAGCMPEGLILFDQFISLAFGGLYVEEFGTRYILEIGYGFYQFEHMVPVYGPEIPKSQGFKKIAGSGNQAFEAALQL